MSGAKIIEGLHGALAFARIQKLIDKEERRKARLAKVHPGVPPVFIECRIQALKDAQACFGRSHTVRVPGKTRLQTTKG